MITDLRVAVRALGWLGWCGVVVAVVAIGAFPMSVDHYTTSLALSVGMYIVLAASWNLMAGFAGYVSFGHVAFWGMGAYGTAVVASRAEVPWPVAMLGGAGASLALALVMMVPILRLSGVYFAISTLAVAEAVRVFVGYFELTGAGGGLSLPPLLTLIDSFYLMWILVLVSVGFTYTLRYNRFGRSLIAIRENEAAAEASGIPTGRVKATAFLLSAVLAGCAGSIYVLNVAFIDPGTAFDIRITLTTIMVAMLGGIGTVLGPVVGALAFQVPSEMLWSEFPEWHKAAQGAFIIIVVMLVPKGLIPAAGSLRRRFARPSPAGAPQSDERTDEKEPVS
jgi:branched-chain amino acid transport system permease protein